MGNCMSSQKHHAPQPVKSFGGCGSTSDKGKSIPLSQRGAPALETAASNGKAISEALNSPVNLKIALIAASNTSESNGNTIPNNSSSKPLLSPQKKNTPKRRRGGGGDNDDDDNPDHDEDDHEGLNSTMPLTPVSLLSSANNNTPHHHGDAATSTSSTTATDSNNPTDSSTGTPTNGGMDQNHNIHDNDEHPVISLKNRSDDSMGADQPFFYSVGPDGTRMAVADQETQQQSTTTLALTTTQSNNAHKNTRQGRALQARLQKARYMLMVMAESSKHLQQQQQQDGDNKEENNNSAPPQRAFFMADDGTNNNNNASADYESGSETASDAGDRGSLQLPLQYSTSLNNNNDNKSMLSNDEFEASMNQGMIWAEVECDSNVLTVALSRQVPTLECTTPQLFLAVGTDAGKLSVTELMDDTTTTAGNTAPSSEANSSNSKARLGSTMTLQRQGRIRSLDFSPDGTCLACAGDDGMCALIMVEQPQEQPMEGNHTNFAKHLRILTEISRVDRIYAIQFSPDGQFLAIGGYDASVAIVDVTSLTAPHIVAEIPVDGLISTLDWSPDGALLAIGGSDKLCTLVDATQNWQILHDLRRPAAITCTEWHPNGRHLAIGSSDVVVVNLETMQVEKEISFQNEDNHDDSMSLSNASIDVMSSTSSITSGRRPSSAAKALVRINDLCWSPVNGNYLVVCANNHRAKLLETKTYSTIQDIRRRANICSVVWGQQTRISSVPHRFLAMGGEDKKVLILKAGLSSHSGGTGSSIGDDTSAASSYLSNRGDWVLKENVFKDMDEGGGEGDALTMAQTDGEVQKLPAAAKVVSFSRGSKSRPSAFFAAACDDGTVALRSTIGWSVLCRLEFLNPMSCIAFSNGSRIMACGADDGKVQIIATAPVWSIATVIDAGAPVTDVCFSKDNSRLAIVGNDGFLGLVDPQDNFALASEMELESVITAVEWSSRNFVVAQEDGTVSVYPVADVLKYSFEEIEPTTFSRPTPVRTLSFGYRGRLLAVGGDDGVLAIYNTEAGWPVVHNISVDFSISRVRWSPTGRHLAIAGHNNNLKVVDTVFWAEIEELNKYITPSRSGALSVDTSLGFSQDGKFLAFTTNYHSGTRIINTVTWELVLDLEGELGLEGAMTAPAASSLSSSVIDNSYHEYPEETEPSFHKLSSLDTVESFHKLSSLDDTAEGDGPPQETETFEEMISQGDSRVPQFNEGTLSHVDATSDDQSRIADGSAQISSFDRSSYDSAQNDSFGRANYGSSSAQNDSFEAADTNDSFNPAMSGSTTQNNSVERSNYGSADNHSFKHAHSGSSRNDSFERAYAAADSDSFNPAISGSTTQSNSFEHSNYGSADNHSFNPAISGSTTQSNSFEPSAYGSADNQSFNPAISGSTTQNNSFERSNYGSMDNHSFERANSGSAQNDSFEQACAAVDTDSFTPAISGSTTQNNSIYGSVDNDSFQHANSGTGQIDSFTQTNSASTRIDSFEHANSGSAQNESFEDAKDGYAEDDNNNMFISELDALDVVQSNDEEIEQFKLMQLPSESLRTSFVADEDDDVADEDEDGEVSPLDQLNYSRSHGDEDTVEEYELPPESADQFAISGSNDQDELPVGSDLFDM